LLFTYGVGVGGVEVGAHDALLLGLGEDGLGVRVGECGRHDGGCGWGRLVCLGVYIGWVLGGSGNVVRVGGRKGFVVEGEGKGKVKVGPCLPEGLLSCECDRSEIASCPAFACDT
jgi:hypothetical protein